MLYVGTVYSLFSVARFNVQRKKPKMNYHPEITFWVVYLKMAAQRYVAGSAHDETSGALATE